MQIPKRRGIPIWLPLRLWQNTLKFMLQYLHEIQQSRFSGILMEAEP